MRGEEACEGLGKTFQSEGQQTPRGRNKQMCVQGPETRPVWPKKGNEGRFKVYCVREMSREQIR